MLVRALTVMVTSLVEPEQLLLVGVMVYFTTPSPVNSCSMEEPLPEVAPRYAAAHGSYRPAKI